MNITANNFYFSIIEKVPFSGLFALFNYWYVGYISRICFCKFIVINGEHIANISICVDNLSMRLNCLD